MRHNPTYPTMIDKIDFIRDQLAFRIPRKIGMYTVDENKYSTFYCPSCNMPITRDYQRFCSECGQMIDWSDIEFIE